MVTLINWTYIPPDTTFLLSSRIGLSTLSNVSTKHYTNKHISRSMTITNGQMKDHHINTIYMEAAAYNTMQIGCSYIIGHEKWLKYIHNYIIST